MALFKRREGEVSVATAGVVTEAEPTRSGRMQGRKTKEKELVEGQSEADGQPHGCVQEKQKIIGEEWPLHTVSGSGGVLTLSRSAPIDEEADGIRCEYCQQTLLEGDIDGSDCDRGRL